jgi:uncharacterized protein (TIGR02996 family)
VVEVLVNPDPFPQERSMPGSVFTSEEKGFLRAILNSPTDRTVRLVYADWLDERDDRKADYLRTEVELHALADSDADRREELRRRLVALRSVVDPFWLACFDRPWIEGCDDHFAFRCPKKWEQLRTTDDAAVRFCDACERPVYYCESIGEAQLHADAGECVAVSLTLFRRPGDVVFEGGPGVMGEFVGEDSLLDEDGRDPKDAD